MLTTISKAQYVNIPDSNFRKYLIQTFPACFNGAGMMDTTCSGVVNATSIYCSHGNISDLTGLGYFKNLTYLDCSYNPLYNLPSLPIKLTYLECSGDSLSSLSVLPNQLSSLDFSENQVTTLPVLPNSLSILYCINNKISLDTMPVLPNNLSQLSSFGNYIKYFPKFPNSLQSLECGNDSLISIGTLPDSLKYFDCSGSPYYIPPSILPSSLISYDCSETKTTTLPTLPNTLTELISRVNNLTYLPPLPSSLNILDVEYNNLTNLPPLPAGINYLYVSNNKFTNLPPLPLGLNTLECSGNNIYCLPFLPYNLSYLYIDTTKIRCLPNEVNNNILIYDVDINTSNNTKVSMAVCNPTNNTYLCQPYPTINGKTFYDINKNGIKDLNEPYNAYAMLSLNNGDYTYTDTSGAYQISADTIGSFTLSATAPPYFNLVPVSQSFNFSSYDTVVTANDFALQSSITKDSLFINITPLMLSGRPGADFEYYVSYYNAGTTVLSPNIVFNYDNNLLSFVSSNNTSVKDNGNNLNLTSYTFQPGKLNEFIATFRLKTSDKMGSIINSNVSITGGSAFATDTATNIVISSFDPNDKQATPTLTPVQVVKGDRIKYTIRFQNTGTASAINVVIADTLSSLLQANTMDIINTSHPCKITMKNNIVYFEFLNINLPDSFASKDLSHGFVSFSIKPVSTVTLGNSIPNTASIYFDYNSPVVTNTAHTIISNTALPVKLTGFTASLQNEENVLLNWFTTEEINTALYNIQISTNGKEFKTIGTENAKGRGAYHYTDNLTTDDSRFTTLYYRLEIVDKDGKKTYSEIRSVLLTTHDSRLTIFPNPAKDFITIESTNMQQIKIVDNTGRLVKTIQSPSAVNSFSLNITYLSKGLYLVQAINTDGVIQMQKLLIQ